MAIHSHAQSELRKIREDDTRMTRHVFVPHGAKSALKKRALTRSPPQRRRLVGQPQRLSIEPRVSVCSRKPYQPPRQSLGRIRISIRNARLHPEQTNLSETVERIQCMGRVGHDIVNGHARFRIATHAIDDVAYCCFSDPLHSRCDACLARCAQCAKVVHGGLVMCHSHGCSACLHASSPQTQTRHADPSLFPLGQPHTNNEPRVLCAAAAGLVSFASFGSFFASPVECLVWCCVFIRSLLRRQASSQPADSTHGRAKGGRFCHRTFPDLASPKATSRHCSFPN